MTAYVFGLVTSLLTLGLIGELLRRGRLREKYAALWIVVGLLVLVVSVFPSLLFLVADAVGVQTPLNLALFASALLLLVVSVQLSAEVGELEEESRTLAEELALLRHAHERLVDRVDGLAPGSPDDGRRRDGR